MFLCTLLVFSGVPLFVLFVTTSFEPFSNESQPPFSLSFRSTPYKSSVESAERDDELRLRAPGSVRVDVPLKARMSCLCTCTWMRVSLCLRRHARLQRLIQGVSPPVPIPSPLSVLVYSDLSAHLGKVRACTDSSSKVASLRHVSVGFFSPLSLSLRNFERHITDAHHAYIYTHIFVLL